MPSPGISAYPSNDGSPRYPGLKIIWSTGPSSISAYAAPNSTIVGQPRPSRRADSRTRSAPAP